MQLHKELLDRHVSDLIDVVSAQAARIRELEMNQKPVISCGKSQLNPKLGKTKSSADLLTQFRLQADTGDLK